MLGQFRDFSGSIYQNPKVNVVVDDGRSYIRRSNERYDVIQASLVDTWAATAAGAYTLTENTLYTKEAFEDYYDHLTDRGMLTITRWVFDGLRLVSLAQAACESRGCSAADHMAIVQQDRVATFLLKKTPFTAGGRRSSCARPSAEPRLHGPLRAGADRREQRLREARARAGSAGVLRRATITTSRRRPTTARSSFTRRKSRISFRPRSAAACCSATA